MRYPRFAAALLLVLSFAICIAEEEKKQPEPKELLQKYMAKETDAKAKSLIAGSIVSLGDKSVTPIMAVYTTGGLDPIQMGSLVQMLGQIGTPAAFIQLKRVTAMKGSVAMQALKAIGSMQSKQANDFLLSYKPTDNDTAQYLVRALMNVPGAEAIERLIGALISSNPGVSARARQILEKRFEKDGRSYRPSLEANVRKLVAAERGGKPRPPHTVKNILMIAASLPQGDGSEMFARCLEDTESLIAVTAFTVLQSYPKMATNPDVRESLKTKLNASKDDTKLVGAIMDVLRNAGDIEALPIVASQLASTDRDTAFKATDVMRTLTGENLGRNPVRWSKWYQDKGQEAMTRIRSKQVRPY